MIKKKKRQPRIVSPVVMLMLVTSMFGFVLMGIGFHLMTIGHAITLPYAAPTDVMQQLNPDATQIPMTQSAITPDTHPQSATFAALLNDVNAARIADGLAPLTLNSRLNQAAAMQASYNASRYLVSHMDATAQLADSRVERTGYAWGAVAENLMSNWTLDGNETFTHWQNSQAHNANMMSDAYSEIGLAYHVTPIGQVYYAMVLAHPE